jgi:hypothetical protein
MSGAFAEAANLSAQEAFSDFGLTLVLLGLAGGSGLAADANGVGSPFVGCLKGLVAFFVALAIFGFGRALSHTGDSRRRKRAPDAVAEPHENLRSSGRPQAVLVGTLRTVTAVVNLIAAMRK